MTLQRRLSMWFRATYLDRWVGALVAILVLVTLLTTIMGLSVPIVNWWGYAQYWLPVAGVMAGYYGYSRAQHFHPLLNSAYGEWLYDQPWIHPQPLPMGPWHFVWQDVLFVALLALVASVGGFAFPLYFDTTPLNCSLLIVALFLSGYVWTTFVNAALCHEKYAGLGVPLIYTSLLWVWQYRLMVAALLLAAAGLAHFSARRMLVNFHQVLPWRAGSLSDRYSLTQEGTGWPYDRLVLRVRNPIVSLEQAVSLSVVAGWCAATVAHIPYLVQGSRRMSPSTYDELLSATHSMLWFLSIMLVVARGSHYFRGMRMPISLLGRIATGNWIIPRFDRVLLPLVVLLLIGGLVPTLLTRLRAPLEVAAGVTVLLLVLVTLGMGPTLHDWWHAGDQQLVFQKKKQAKYISTQ
jgi:hypothetical protein